VNLPFSNAFWAIVLLLVFYGVFGLWVPNQQISQMANQEEQMINQHNKEMRRTIEALQPSVYEQEVARAQDRVAYKLTAGDKLVIAARVWDMAMMKALIRDGADVNYMRTEGTTVNGTKVYGVSPLMAGADNLEVVKLLIDSGADIQLKDIRGKTALTYALDALNGSHKDPGVPQYLLAHGAQIKVTDSIDDSNPLMTAIYNEAPMSIIEQLVGNGVDINAQTSMHRSALTIAAEKGRTDVVDYLINQGADLGRDAEQALNLASANNHAGVVSLLSRFVTPDDKTARAALDAAAYDGDVATVLALLQRFDVSDGQGDKAMMTAISRGHLDVVKLLVEQGVSVNVASNEDTGLLLALWYKHPEIFNYLLQKGADINATTPQLGRSPLHQAAAHHRLDVVQALIAHGADINRVDKQGNTPLMTVVRSGWYTKEIELPESQLKELGKQLVDMSKEKKEEILNIVSVLLAQNPDLKAQDEDGNNAAFLALKNHLPELLPTILTSPLETGLVNNEGESLMQLSLEQSDFDSILMLSARGENVNVAHGHITPLILAIKKGNADVVSALINAGADVNQYASDMNALDVISEGRFSDIGKLLLAAEIDLNSFSGTGHSALMRSVLYTGEARCQWLLEAGADVNQQHKLHGDTALHYAVNTRNLTVVKLLLEHGADPYIKNEKGESAYFRAITNAPTIDLLMKSGFVIPADDPHFLEYAWSKRLDSLFMFLLANGSNPNLWLQKKHAHSLFYRVVQAKYEVLAKEMLLHGVDVDLGQKTGFPTVLMLAIEAGLSLDFIQGIVAKTKLINMVSSPSSSPVPMTALDLALALHRDDVATVLKKAGATEAVLGAPVKSKATNVSLVKSHVQSFLNHVDSGECKQSGKKLTFPLWFGGTYITSEKWQFNCLNMKYGLEGFKLSEPYYPISSKLFMLYVNAKSIRDIDLEKTVLLDVDFSKTKPKQRNLTFILSCSAYNCSIVGFSESSLKD